MVSCSVDETIRNLPLIANEGLNMANAFAINSESEVIYVDEGYATHLAFRVTLETI